MALFTLNPTSKLATHSQYICETGAYPCKILSASAWINKEKGSESIKFEVETKDGKKANFWVCHSSPNFDASQCERAYAEINSIMLCAGVQTMDADKNGIYQPLCNKGVGVVFQMEEGLYKGEISTNPAYRMCFVVQTGQTAQEKRDNVQAVELNRYLASLAPVKALKSPVQPAVTAKDFVKAGAGIPNSPAAAFDDFSEDVPF